MPTQQTLTPEQEMQAAQPKYEMTEADRERQKKIAAAWRAYFGELAPPLKKMPDGTDPNVNANQIQPKVDRINDFLFGKELDISVGEGAPQEAKLFLDSVWGRKERRIPLLLKLAMNGAMAGQAFLRIVPMKDGSFRLVGIDPSTICVQTAAQDCETVLLYCIEYSCTEKYEGKSVQIFYREEITRLDPQGDDPDTASVLADRDTTWQIQHWTRIGEKGKWTPAGDPFLWPYPFAPLHSCQNLPLPNSFWGMPDVTPDLAATNESLNLNLSCMEIIQILYGQPILYSTGTGESELDIQPGKIIGLPTTESKIVAVAITSDQANALSFAEGLRRDIAEQTGVPNVATGRDLPPGTLSGIAIELLFMPIIKKMDKKRCLFGELILDVSQALLRMSGFNSDIELTLHWQNPLPNDDLAAVQAALSKQSAGVSKATTLREMGYDPEEEARLKAEEDADTLTKFTRGQGMPPLEMGQEPPEEGEEEL